MHLAQLKISLTATTLQLLSVIKTSLISSSRLKYLLLTSQIPATITVFFQMSGQLKSKTCQWMQGLILYPSCFKKGIKQIKFRSCKQNKLTQDFNSNQKKRFFVLSSNSELGYTKLELSLEDKQKLQSCVKFVKEI